VDTVKVILSENVPNLGEMGAEVKVADGYARNFLLPRKLAVRADSASAKQIDHEKRIIGKREEKQRAVFAEQAKHLEALTVEIKVRAGEEEKIFGSVTTANIADALKKMGQDIDRRAIQLEEPIKSIGIFSVPVRLARDIEANIKVWVSTLEEAE
jgi:large subunit ribosomal protein L9